MKQHGGIAHAVGRSSSGYYWSASGMEKAIAELLVVKERHHQYGIHGWFQWFSNRVGPQANLLVSVI